MEAIAAPLARLKTIEGSGHCAPPCLALFCLSSCFFSICSLGTAHPTGGTQLPPVILPGPLLIPPPFLNNFHCWQDSCTCMLELSKTPAAAQELFPEYMAASWTRNSLALQSQFKATFISFPAKSALLLGLDLSGWHYHPMSQKPRPAPAKSTSEPLHSPSH